MNVIKCLIMINVTKSASEDEVERSCYKETVHSRGMGEPKPAFKACTPPEAVSGCRYLHYLHNYTSSCTSSIVNGVVSRYNVSKAQTNGCSQAHTEMT